VLALALSVCLSGCFFDRCLRCECLSDNIFIGCQDPFNNYQRTHLDVNFCEEEGGWQTEDFRDIELEMMGYGWLCTND